MKQIISFIIFAFSLNFIYGMEESESNANAEKNIMQLASDRNILNAHYEHEPELLENIMS